MQRRLRIRRWLALGLALGTLSFTSAASANVIAGDGTTGGGGGAVVLPQTPTVVTESPQGFSWSDAAIGAGAALGAVLGGAGVAGLARGQRRIPGLAQ